MLTKLARLRSLIPARIRLALWAVTRYAPVAGGSGEGEGGSGAGGQGGDGNSGGEGGSGSGNGSGSGGSGGSDKTFTQADVDRIVQERVARAEGKFKDYSELREKAKKLDDLEAASQSELEKANKRAEKAEKDAADRTAAADRRLKEAAVLTAATQQNAIKPEHMFKLIDGEKVTVGDDGQVAGAEDAVKAFLEANPEYVGNTRRQGGGADQGARGGSGPDQIKSTEGMSSEQISKALAEGRLNDYLTSPR